MASHNKWTLGMSNEFGGLGQEIVGRTRSRRLHRLHILCGSHMIRGAILRLRELHVLWHIDQDRTRTTTTRNNKCFVYNTCEFLYIAHQEIMLRNRLSQAKHIGLLETIAPNQMPTYLTSKGHDRDRIHKGCRQTGNQIGSPRPARSNTHTYFTSCTSITISRVHRCLLMANQYVMQRRICGKRIVKGHNCATWI